MKLSIVIVNYNVCYFLEQALKSVQNAIEHMEAEVFVVDNNSVDGSVEMVREKFPWVHLIANKDNTGFSKANNQAMRIAKGEYILLLNPDTVVEEDTFEKCCAFMDEHPEAGGLGVKMVDGNGIFLPESKRGLPTPWVAFTKISGLASFFPKSEKFGQYHLGYLDDDETHEVEILAGAYMLMRKETLDKVGLLDEDYFMYGEDIDLSWRIVQGGYKNYYFPDTRIIHYKGESTKKSSVNYVFVFYNAMAIFARKHFSPKQAGLFSFLINIAIYMKAGMDIGMNFFRQIFLSLCDAGMMFGGLYFLQDYWESTFKPEASKFPPELITTAFPVYILIWLFANHFSGGNDKPYRLGRILRGVLVGTLVISAMSNFVDSYRFSKSLIVLGGAWAGFVMLFNRLMVHFRENGNLILGQEREKRLVLVGSPDEAKRVEGLLDNLQLNLNVLGFVGAGEQESSRKEGFLGTFSQLDEVVEIHKADEVVFCSKDISAQKIIGLMMEPRSRSIEFKIVPDDSDYVIGSNSKNRPGDFYTINVELNILKQGSMRLKRSLDVALAVFLLLSFPLTCWFVEQKGGLWANSWKVLFGKCSWVGFGDRDDLTLPKIKKGVLTTKGTDYPDARYAKDYNPWMDLRIILGGFGSLGG